MLELLANIAVLFSLGLFIPCFIVMLYIIKHFSTKVLKQHIAFKIFLFNGLIHSILLAAYLVEPLFNTALSIFSFFMIPTYIMLLLRELNFKIQANIRQKVLKEVAIETSSKQRLAARLKREKIRLIAKSKWR